MKGEKIMDKRISSRAIIVENDSLLTMFRRKIKEGKVIEYYVIPGGGLEENETLEENVIRELKEEFSIDIEILGYLGMEEHEKTIEHYFHCKIINGTPKLGGEEKDRMSEENYYEVRRIKLEELENIDINAKDKVKMAINHEYVEME
jgi:ADP-ribose pyrophosphatase YjhB (NUDIX family)